MCWAGSENLELRIREGGIGFRLDCLIRLNEQLIGINRENKDGLLF